MDLTIPKARLELVYTNADTECKMGGRQARQHT